jgi:hypothetical protein
MPIVCSNNLYLVCCGDNTIVIQPCNPTIDSISDTGFTNNNIYYDSNNICWSATNTPSSATTSNITNTYTTFAGNCTTCQTSHNGSCATLNDYCYCITIDISQSDITSASGNTVYVDIFSCSGGTQILEFTTSGITSVCGRLESQPYYFNGLSVKTSGTSTADQTLTGCPNGYCEVTDPNCSYCDTDYTWFYPWYDPETQETTDACYTVLVTGATDPAIIVPLASTGYTFWSYLGTNIYSTYDIDGSGTPYGYANPLTTSPPLINGIPDATDGPMNRCAVWYSGTQYNDRWVGFSTCLTATTATKTYFVGVGGDNEYKIVLDGVLLLNLLFKTIMVIINLMVIVVLRDMFILTVIMSVLDMKLVILVIVSV